MGGMTRRGFIAAAGTGLAGIVARPAGSEFFDMLFPPGIEREEPAPPRNFLKHTAFASPGSGLEWIDSFDQASDLICLEERLLTELSSSDAIVVVRGTAEEIASYTLPASLAAGRTPEQRRTITEAMAKKAHKDLLGLKDARLMLRIGYADVLAEGVERIAPWAEHLKRIAVAQGLDPMLPIALALQETNWSPKLGSSADCHGVFQMNVENTKNYGLHFTRRLNEGHQPLSEAQAALALYRGGIMRTGSAILSLSDYHAGTHMVRMLGAARHLDSSLATDIDAFDWAVRNYDHPINQPVGGKEFSRFKNFSAGYGPRVLAIKNRVAIPAVAEEDAIVVDCVESDGSSALYAPAVCKAYFGTRNEDKRRFVELNPHLATARGAVLPITIPKGVDIYLPLGAGDRFCERRRSKLIRFHADRIEGLPERAPWNGVDDLYAEAAMRRRADGLDAVPEGLISDLYSYAKELDDGTPFRSHQKAALALDRQFFRDEAYGIYKAGKEGRPVR